MHTLQGTPNHHCLSPESHFQGWGGVQKPNSKIATLCLVGIDSMMLLDQCEIRSPDI